MPVVWVAAGGHLTTGTTGKRPGKAGAGRSAAAELRRWPAPSRLATVNPMSTVRRLAMALVVLVVAAIPPAAAGADTPPTDTSPCTRAQARAAFNAFLVAFDRGDYAKLDSLFVGEPDFQWFSSNAPGRRLNSTADDRDSLVPYFRARHRRGDRLRLLDFHFTGRSPHWSGFWFDLRRRSRDFRAGRWFPTTGKGAVVCDGGRASFIVMSIGGPTPDAAQSADT